MGEDASGSMPAVRLENTVQHYAWGGRDFLPRLLGRENPNREPWAELWMGDHPISPSRALLPDGREEGLDLLIARDPGYFLSAPGRDRLPYLLKILSAATPLSLQAHPSLEEAERGFAREEASGLPAGSPERFYKDRNHKPEIIVALEPFSAMCGFREVAKIEEAFGLLAKQAGAKPGDAKPGGVVAAVASRACAILSGGAGALGDFYRWLGGLPAEEARAAAVEAAALAPALAGEGEADIWRTLSFLSSYYPGDPGIFAALYLNQIRLRRLEGFYVPAGILHSYLGGTGVELMASSDNVLRGGLSPKKVDMAALTEVLRFEPFAPKILKPVAGPEAWSSYGAPCADFELSLLTGPAVRDGAKPEILICLEGAFTLKSKGAAELAFAPGVSAFVPARSGAYSLSGKGLLFRAAPGHAERSALRP